jgi:nitrite reductase/ring-hydroxylating ferredoxin subunit
MAEEQGLIALCATSDVTQDLPVKAELNGEDVVVFQVGDQYHVTQDRCTHGPGSLSEGYVERDEIECPFHQGKFSIITGLPTSPPCTVPLRTWTVQVRDGQVCAAPLPRPTEGEAPA